MNSLLKKLDSVSSVSVVVCGMIMTGLSVLIALEVILRKFFAVSTKGTDELSSYTFAIISAWSLSYALLKKGHIRIDFLYIKLPHMLQRVCDLVAMVSLAIFVTPMTFYTFNTLKTSIVRLSKANTPLQTPLWIPQSLWFSGLFFFFIVVIIVTLSIVIMAANRKFREMAALSGCLGLEEEIQQEGLPGAMDGGNGVQQGERS